MAKLNDEMIAELCVLTTRDESGRHFTSWSDHYETLEDLGLVEIRRPTHDATGIPYSCEHFTIEITGEGMDVVDSNPELHPA